MHVTLYITRGPKVRTSCTQHMIKAVPQPAYGRNLLASKKALPSSTMSTRLTVEIVRLSQSSQIDSSSNVWRAWQVVTPPPFTKGSALALFAPIAVLSSSMVDGTGKQLSLYWRAKLVVAAPCPPPAGHCARHSQFASVRQRCARARITGRCMHVRYRVNDCATDRAIRSRRVAGRGGAQVLEGRKHCNERFEGGARAKRLRT